MKHKINYKHLSIYLILLSALFFLLVIGTTMNHVAITKNGGRMPVYSSVFYSTTTHFTFQDKRDVNYFLFTDIIPLGVGVWSIGDFILFFSGFSITFLLGFAAFSTFLKKKCGIWETG